MQSPNREGAQRASRIQLMKTGWEGRGKMRFIKPGIRSVASLGSIIFIKYCQKFTIGKDEKCVNFMMNWYIKCRFPMSYEKVTPVFDRACRDFVISFGDRISVVR